MDTVQQHKGTLGFDGLSDSAMSLAGPRDYYALMKPRVMSLVVFTALVGFICAPGTMNPVLAAASILCIAAGAGASGALNMWYDRDIDAIMSRTKKRPLPAGKMAPSSVLAFGIIMSVVSVFGLAVASNYLAAGLLAFIFAWNNFIFALVLASADKQPVTVGALAFITASGINYGQIAAGIMLSIAPTFALALYAQRYLVEGLSLGAVKG